MVCSLHSLALVSGLWLRGSCICERETVILLGVRFYIFFSLSFPPLSLSFSFISSPPFPSFHFPSSPSLFSSPSRPLVLSFLPPSFPLVASSPFSRSSTWSESTCNACNYPAADAHVDPAPCMRSTVESASWRRFALPSE